DPAGDLARVRAAVLVDRLVLDHLGLGVEPRGLLEHANRLLAAERQPEVRRRAGLPHRHFLSPPLSRPWDTSSSYWTSLAPAANGMRGKSTTRAGLRGQSPPSITPCPASITSCGLVSASHLTK